MYRFMPFRFSANAHKSSTVRTVRTIGAWAYLRAALTISLSLLASCLAAVLFWASLLALFSTSAHAQSAPVPSATNTTNVPNITNTPNIANAPSANTKSAPVWSQLNALHQAALKPLQGEWGSLEASQKKKWLAVADKYPKLASADQARMHERMVAWAKLSPAQRAAARDNYSSVLSSPSSKPEAGSDKANLNAQYEKYLALPPEKRAELKSKAEKAEADKAAPAKSKPL